MTQRAKSARRIAEEALARSQRQYRELVEHSLGLVCAHDLDGVLLFVNPAAARSLGYEQGEGEGANLRQFLAAGARDRFDEYLDRIRRNGVDSGLMRLVAKDGRERVWMYRNILYDEPPDPPRVLGHAVDITDRVQTEKALRESQDTLTRTLSELDARVLERTGDLQRANERLQAEIIERQRAEEARERVLVREGENLAFWASVGKQLAAGLDYETTLRTVARLPVPFLADWTLLHVVLEPGTCRCVAGAHVDAERQPGVDQLATNVPSLLRQDSYVARVLSTRQPESVALASGATVGQWLGSEEQVELIQTLGADTLLVVPLAIGDHVLGALSLVSASDGFTETDLAVLEVLARRSALAIDRARLYRQAEEANRLKDEFLATLSHELRTPLQAVIGWARILRNRQLDASSDRAAAVIERNGLALSRMVEDLLDVSRIITGRLTLHERRVDLSLVLGAALDSVRPAARAKGVDVVHHIETPAEVVGDEQRLQQVLWNLLSNAVKFTGPGGTITVTLQQAHGMVTVTVSDTGVGIRRDVLPFVFDRFRQGDASSTRTHGGLGLGLAIVRHIVELHGGAVRAESVEGRGATFSVELPAAPVARDGQTLELGPSAGHAAVAFGQVLLGTRVLVVDNEADARELVAEMIHQAGGIAVTAASNQQALRQVTAFGPDVLIADIGLPHEDGYQLIRQIRQLPSAQSRRLVAIALTGYTRAEDRSRALAAGFQEHVAKPVEPHTLIRIVRATLDEKP